MLLGGRTQTSLSSSQKVVQGWARLSIEPQEEVGRTGGGVFDFDGCTFQRHCYSHLVVGDKAFNDEEWR